MQNSPGNPSLTACILTFNTLPKTCKPSCFFLGKNQKANFEKEFYFYQTINKVNASHHSCSCFSFFHTKITVEVNETDNINILTVWNRTLETDPQPEQTHWAHVCPQKHVPGLLSACEESKELLSCARMQHTLEWETISCTFHLSLKNPRLHLLWAESATRYSDSQKLQ